MTTIVISILIIFIFLAINWWTDGFTSISKSILTAENKTAGYKKKNSLMNGSESALFFELQKQLPSSYHIFPNMRLADIVESVNGHGFYKRRNKILPRHIDFVICDSFFKPMMAIELNGSSHNRLDRMEIDEEKKNILEEAQIPLITVKAGDNFTESVLKMKSFL